MNTEQQQRYYELGRSYWWLAGKYRVIDDVVRRTFRPLRPQPRILDLGCGPGNLLDLIARQGDTFGSDFSGDALRFCYDRGYHRLFRADFHSLPIRGESFDLVTCIDVLEHLKEDRRAFLELARILRPSGLLVVSVPAFQFLWGDHDTIYGHHRRYRTGEVRERLEAVGLEVLKLSYFEPLFVAPLWLYRNWKKVTVRGSALHERDDFIKLFPPLNTLLSHMIAAERFPLRFFNFPFGVTILAVARKKPAPAAG
jgi:SAM-dependent methyltransferase